MKTPKSKQDLKPKEKEPVVQEEDPVVSDSDNEVIYIFYILINLNHFYCFT